MSLTLFLNHICLQSNERPSKSVEFSCKIFYGRFVNWCLRAEWWLRSQRIVWIFRHQLGRVNVWLTGFLVHTSPFVAAYFYELWQTLALQCWIALLLLQTKVNWNEIFTAVVLIWYTYTQSMKFLPYGCFFFGMVLFKFWEASLTRRFSISDV